MHHFGMNALHDTTKAIAQKPANKISALHNPNITERTGMV